MSHREIDRLSVVQLVERRRLTQIQAASQLGLSVRQVKRLVRAYRKQGAVGLVSRHRGKPPNNAIAPAARERALSLVRATYSDFSPTFAHEKLTEQHALNISVEALRKWMIEAGFWTPRARKSVRIHQSRVRRPRAGELIQIDGSPHDWFEGRAPQCTLIVFIDDATRRLMALRFAPAETTQAYMETLSLYLGQHGRPVALYSDRHSIFRVNNRADDRRTSLSLPGHLKRSISSPFTPTRLRPRDVSNEPTKRCRIALPRKYAYGESAPSTRPTAFSLPLSRTTTAALPLRHNTRKMLTGRCYTARMNSL